MKSTRNPQNMNHHQKNLIESAKKMPALSHWSNKPEMPPIPTLDSIKRLR